MGYVPWVCWHFLRLCLLFFFTIFYSMSVSMFHSWTTQPPIHCHIINQQINDRCPNHGHMPTNLERRQIWDSTAIKDPGWTCPSFVRAYLTIVAVTWISCIHMCIYIYIYVHTHHVSITMTEKPSNMKLLTSTFYESHVPSGTQKAFKPAFDITHASRASPPTWHRRSTTLELQGHFKQISANPKDRNRFIILVVAKLGSHKPHEGLLRAFFGVAPVKPSHKSPNGIRP